MSCGLIPENELSESLGAAINPATGGPLVDESLETNQAGVFACGNVLHVHDLVDYVSEEAENAGRNAAAYIMRGRSEKEMTGSSSGQVIEIKADKGVRYTVPSLLRQKYVQEEQVIRFRVGDAYRDAVLAVYFNDTPVMRINKRAMVPGEMEQVKLKKSKLKDYPELREIRIAIE